MKKGFTLVELLAVLVIISLISLIILPVVSNVIENSRKKAAEMSASNYIDAVRNQIALSINKPSITFEDGAYDVETLRDDYDVIVKDNYPTEGTVNIADNSIINAQICISKYYVSYSDGIFRILGECEDNN